MRHAHTHTRTHAHTRTQARTHTQQQQQKPLWNGSTPNVYVVCISAYTCMRFSKGEGFVFGWLDDAAHHHRHLKDLWPTTPFVWKRTVVSMQTSEDIRKPLLYYYQESI